MDEAFLRHYSLGLEGERLLAGGDHLELVRTLELLSQVLPPPPASLLDVGGGPGVYASRFAQAGYHVHLVDVFPAHVEQARERAAQAWKGRAAGSISGRTAASSCCARRVSPRTSRQ